MRVLKNYNPVVQQTGTWLEGYPWTLSGCGTFRVPTTPKYAEALMKRFMEKLRRRLKVSVSYFAALERRYSGCGLSPIPLHWHFLAACGVQDDAAGTAQRLW